MSVEYGRNAKKIKSDKPDAEQQRQMQEQLINDNALRDALIGKRQAHTIKSLSHEATADKIAAQLKLLNSRAPDMSVMTSTTDMDAQSASIQSAALARLSARNPFAAVIRAATVIMRGIQKAREFAQNVVNTIILVKLWIIAIPGFLAWLAIRQLKAAKLRLLYRKHRTLARKQLELANATQHAINNITVSIENDAKNVEKERAESISNETETETSILGE